MTLVADGHVFMIEHRDCRTGVTSRRLVARERTRPFADFSAIDQAVGCGMDEMFLSSISDLTKRDC
jgi:hypothetical protein